MSFKSTQKFYQSTTQPPNPNPGDEWLNTSTNRNYQFMALSGNSPTWVETAIAPTTDLFNMQNLTVVNRANFPGTTNSLALNTTNLVETVALFPTAPIGVMRYNVTSQTVAYITANATTNIVLNITGSDTTTLDSLLTIGQSISCALLFTNGSPAYYVSAVRVDGVAPSIIKWQGGSAPSAGNTSSIDSYTFSVIKTATATFTVLAAQVKFA